MTINILALAILGAATFGVTAGLVHVWAERLRVPLPVKARARDALERAWLYLVWLALRAYACMRPMITARCPDTGEPIFHRWFLTSRPVGGSTGTPGWYLHHLTAPDYDPEEHNHPWLEARTTVLRGWYTETRGGVRRARFAGDTAHFGGNTFHRITSVRRGTWTLFYAGPKHGRGWGFADGRKARDPNGKHVTLVLPCVVCGGRATAGGGVNACSQCIGGLL